jgi:hypothetical protein
MISDISATLTDDTSIPLAPGVATDLSTNIWTAHETTDYALAEADSLGLSITAVLRAIMLSAPAPEIVSQDLTPLPWLQSEIAIDDRVSVDITPTAIDFGDVAIPTPEPPTFEITALGLVVVALIVIRKRLAVRA